MSRKGPILVLLGCGVLAVVCIALRWSSRSGGDSSASKTEPGSNGALAPPTIEDPAVRSGAAPSPPSDVTRAIADDLPPPVDLEKCDRDLDLFGIVVDAKGDRIAGAKVETIAHPWRRTVLLESKRYYESQPGPSTRTARDGTFAIRLHRGDRVELRASQPGFATKCVADAEAGERLRVVLNPASELRITTKDEKGAAVAGVKVRFWRRAIDAADEREGVTDDIGRCTFSDMESGKGTVRFEHALFGEPGWKTVEIASGGVTALDVTMPAGRTVRGRITDSTNGHPIAGANVGENWVMGRLVHSDADGRYEILGYTGNGSTDVHVTAEGYGRAGKDVPKEGDLDFQLSPADDARGLLLAPDKKPLPAVRVSVIASENSGAGQQIDAGSAETASDGTFHLTSLRHDLPHTLVVQAPGFGRLARDFKPHSGGPGTIELGEVVLAASRAIEGRVLSSEGKPLPEVQISSSGPLPVADFYGTSETRRTDDLGRFRFPDLAPGSYRLTARIEGRPEFKREVAIPAEGDLTGVELRVPTGTDLSVRVVDEAGAGVADVTVSINTDTYVDARTDAQGLAVLRGLPGMSTYVNVWAGEDRVADRVQVVPAGQEIRIVLHPVAVVEGRIVDENGQILPDMSLVVVDDHGPSTYRADASGAFTIRAKAGTNLDLRVGGQRQKKNERGGIQVEETAYRGELVGVVAPAKDLTIVARKMPQTAHLDVRVVAPDGSPVEGAVVEATESTTRSNGVSQTTDAEGRVRIGGLVDTGFRVAANPPRKPKAEVSELVRSASSTVKANDPEVTLTLRKGTRWNGRVVDAKGSSIANAQVSARDPSDSSAYFYFRAQSDAAGRFTLLVVPGAHYQVSAYSREAKETSARSGALADAAPEGGEITIVLDP